MTAALMEYGYSSIRRIRQVCDTNIRFIWLLDGKNPPSVMTIQNFIHKELSESVEDIFTDINAYIFPTNMLTPTTFILREPKSRPMQKKSCIKNRNKVFAKAAELLSRMNKITRSIHGEEFEIFQEYSIERVEYIYDQFLKITGMKAEDFVSWKRKTKDRNPRDL